MGLLVTILVAMLCVIYLYLVLFWDDCVELLLAA